MSSRAFLLSTLCALPLVAVGAACGSPSLPVAQDNANDAGTKTAAPGSDGGPSTSPPQQSPTCHAALLSQQGALATGAGPTSVGVVDLNADGKVDVVVANGGSNSVSVLLGKGGGEFEAQATYAVGTNPYWIAASDLNGDGKPDLTVIDDPSAGAGAVAVLLNGGGGTMAAAVPYTVGSGPQSLGVADLNGDGKPDVLAANGNDGTATVLLNQGAGTLAARPAINLMGAVTVSLVDFDGDHHVDAALVGLNAVLILLGKGDGTFAPAVSYPVGALASFVAASDLDGDGELDLAVTNTGDDTVSVLLGKGDGTFGAQKTYPTGPQPAQIVAADFDGDGHVDLAVADNGDGNVSLLRGQAGGGFAAAQAFATGATSLWGLAAADVDGDARIDLLATDVPGGKVRVLTSACSADAGANTPDAASPNGDAASPAGNDASIPSDASSAATTCGTQTCNLQTEYCKYVFGGVGGAETYTCTPLPAACGTAPTCACASLPQCGTCSDTQGLITVSCELG